MNIKNPMKNKNLLHKKIISFLVTASREEGLGLKIARPSFCDSKNSYLELPFKIGHK